MSRSFRLDVCNTWDGHPLPADGRARVHAQLREAHLHVRIDAPYHGDPPPATPAGSTPRLWEHEVVELMLLGDDGRYLELEFGPHGHYLALQLHGVRVIVAQGMTLPYAARIDGDRWRGQAEIPADWLPPGALAANAFAIAGVGTDRRYAAAFPAGGAAPDFHRLEVFRPIAELPPTEDGVEARA